MCLNDCAQLSGDEFDYIGGLWVTSRTCAYFLAVENPRASFVRSQIAMSKISLLRMAFNALEHRNVAEVQWMLKRPVRLVAEVAFVVG